MKLPDDTPQPVKALLYAINDLAERERLWWLWIERASIAEFEGGLTREEADKLATAELIERIEAA